MKSLEKICGVVIVLCAACTIGKIGSKHIKALKKHFLVHENQDTDFRTQKLETQKKCFLDHQNATRRKNSSSVIEKRYKYPYKGFENGITIYGLGEVSREDKSYAGKIIKSFFGYDYKISSNLPLKENYFFEGSDKLNGEYCLHQGIQKRNCLVLTHELLYQNEKRLRGISLAGKGVFIVRAKREFMRETLIHEIGHILGLDHCEKKYCVMALKNDEEDSGDFCSFCKIKISKHDF